MLKKFFRCISIALSVAVLICSLPGIALTASAENIATQGQMVVIRKIIYAVETGGQVYGNVRYDDFTEAYTNSSIEYAITIGGGQWYATEAQRLLKLIRSTDPGTFNRLDTAGIGTDLDTKDWSRYQVSKGSAKAVCIQRIISSNVGIRCQDQLIDEQMTAYMAEARSLGVTDIDAQMMCANFRHQGGLGAVKRILGKTPRPYTLDNLYAACKTDTGNQVGAYKSRQKMVYESLKKYLPLAVPSFDTSNPVNLGTNFYAQIVNVNSGKNLAVSLENDNVLIYDRTLNDDHMWKFFRYSDGSYKITNMLNGKALDVYGASNKAGANVQLWESNGSNAQKWFIYKYNGKYVLKSQCTDCVLDIANASTANFANVQTYTFNGTNAQLFTIDILGNDLGGDFDAYIYGTTTYKPIVADSTGNVVLNSGKGDGSEVWHFAKNSNGSYTITNKSGKCLDVDSAIDANEINVGVYESNGTNAQKWFISGSDGGYRLKPMCALGRSLDIDNDVTDDGANVHIYQSHDATAQLFQLIRIGEDIGTDFYANIQGVSSGKLLSTQSNNNVVIRGATGCDDQLWKFERQADNSYKIINVSSGYVLDVYGGLAGNSVNVQTYASNDSKAQRWFVYKQGDGYRLGNKATYCVIDIYNNLPDDETNAQMYTSNGTAAQTFKINKVDNPNLAKNLGDNFFAYIKTKQDPTLRITSASGNALLKDDLMRSTRYWNFKKQSDGSYRIFSVAEGTCLDVAGNVKDNGTNVSLYAEHGENDSAMANQNWYIYEDRGAYVIKSKASGRILDVSGGKFEYGTNIQIWDRDASVPNQLFTIDKPSASVSVKDGGATISWKDFYNGDSSTESFTVEIYKNKYGSTAEAYKTITVDGTATSTVAELEPGNYECKVKTVVGNNTYSTEAVAFTVKSSYLLGDVDLNGVIDIKDATKLQTLLVEETTFDYTMSYICDTYIDGAINVNDVTKIQCYCAGMVSEFINQTKANAFSGNRLWADANPSSSDSTLSLVKMYNNSDSEHYFYMPESAELNSLTLYFDGYTSVKINNKEIKNGGTYSFETNKAYNIVLNNKASGTLKFYQSSTPALYLQTKEPFPVVTYAVTSDGLELSSKDNFNTTGNFATSENGNITNIGNIKKLKGRGNGSWSDSYTSVGKYSYNITLEKKTKLFSTMNKGKKYCLLANNGDEAFVRNTTAFTLANKLGLPFTSTFQYVDVYDNGDYMGSYLVTDKVEINSQSLDLSYSFDDLNETANPDIESCTRSSTSGNINDHTTKGYKKWVDITDPTTDENGNAIDVAAGDGTYLLEFELDGRFPDEISGFISNEGQPVVVKTPEYASKAQVDFISSLFNKAEQAVYSPDSKLEEIEKYIDVESFVKVYIIQELSKNLDACQTSYYVYYDSAIDGRLHAGPVWDFDNSFGQYAEDRYITPTNIAHHESAEGWFANIKGMWNDLSKLNFEARLLNNDEVWSMLQDIWNGENGFYNTAKEYVNGTGKGTLSYYLDEVKDCGEMNESRWGLIAKNIVGGRQDTGATFEETSAYLKNWINRRLDWLNNDNGNATPLSYNAVNSYTEWLDTAETVNLGTEFTGSINNVNSGKNLAIVNNNNVAIWDNTTNNDQLWKFERQADGSYKIINKSNNYCLTVFESLKYGEMNVFIAPGDGSKGQNWYILRDNSGNYVLRAQSSNAVLDVSAASVSNGVNVWAYKYNGSSAQQFTINITE